MATVAVVDDVDFDLPARTPPGGALVFGLLVALVGSVALVEATDGSPLPALLVPIYAALIIGSHLRVPRQACLTADHVTLRARTKETVIAWSDLASVELRGGYLYWRRRSTKAAVETTGLLPDLDRLLAEIAQRAPHAQVQR
jgi:hypothetical protein